MHDDNLFRLSSSVNPQTVLGKSSAAEDITITSATITLNKPYAQQRFEFEAGVNDYRYQNFDYLSYTATPYKAAWRWALTPHVHGNLTTDRNQTLNSFSDYTGYRQQNTRTVENRRFDGVLELSGSWHLTSGVAQSETTNSQATLGQYNTRLNTGDIGVRYRAASGSTLSYASITGAGEYINRSDPASTSLLDNKFTERTNELRGLWVVTGASSLEGRIAHYERSHPHYAMRDFGGNVGNLSWNWAPTAKLALTTSLAKELSSFVTLYSSYIETNRLSVLPVWQIDEKFKLRGKYDYARREYLGEVTAISSNRSDVLSTRMVSLEWQPDRSVVLSAVLQNDKRSSNWAGFDFNSKSIMFTAQLSY